MENFDVLSFCDVSIAPKFDFWYYLCMLNQFIFNRRGQQIFRSFAKHSHYLGKKVDHSIIASLHETISVEQDHFENVNYLDV